MENLNKTQIKVQTLNKYDRNQPLRNWLERVHRDMKYFLSTVWVRIWKMVDEGWVLLRDLGIRELEFDAQFWDRQDCVHRRIMKEVWLSMGFGISREQYWLCFRISTGLCINFAQSMVKHNLNKAVGCLTSLKDIDLYVSRICNMKKQSRRREGQRRQRSLSVQFEGKCGKKYYWVWEKKLPENQML